jgi:hypothetical protein
LRFGGNVHGKFHSLALRERQRTIVHRLEATILKNCIQGLGDDIPLNSFLKSCAPIARISSVELSVKIAAAKIPLPVLVAFLVAAQKTVMICLLVRAAAAEDRKETRSAVPVEVRAFRIEALTTSPIAGAGQQAILVTPLIGVGAVPIVAIV